MTLLYIHALTVTDSRGERLLDRVSLDLDAGQVLGIAGAPGAGKPALCRILAGAHPDDVKIDSGRILLGNRDLVVEPWQDRDKRVRQSPIPIHELPLTEPISREACDVGSIVIDRDPAALAEFCDEIAVLCAGRVVERAPSRALIRAPRHPYTQSLLDRDGPEDSLRHTSDGCPFHADCPHAQTSCAQATMRLQMISAEHTTACVQWRTIWPLAA